MSISQVLRHFHTVDPKIEKELRRVDKKWLPQPKDPSIYFEHLCGEIIGQQLSGRVADVIEARFRKLFHTGVDAKQILDFSEQELRDVGMSWAKVKSVKDLAQKTVQQRIEWRAFPELEDEKVITELTQVKGIGRWTAEMFLIFALGRENVFSFGDLGLKKGLIKLYALPNIVSKETIAEIITPWQPYRSYGCLALWRALEKE